MFSTINLMYTIITSSYGWDPKVHQSTIIQKFTIRNLLVIPMVSMLLFATKLWPFPVFKFQLAEPFFHLPSQLLGQTTIP